MGIFGFGKKKEAQKPACACQCGCPTAEVPVEEAGNLNHGDTVLKVLGTGCASCHALLDNTKTAVAHMGLEATVDYVDDMAKIAAYGVMSVPALVVNEKVVSMGKVLKADEVETLLKKLGF